MAKIIDAAYAQSNLEYLIDEATRTREPICIGENNNQTAVLISEEMWEEIQGRFNELIADQRIDEVKSGKMEVYTLNEVAKKLNLD